jgi:hypothetical protein
MSFSLVSPSLPAILQWLDVNFGDLDRLRTAAPRVGENFFGLFGRTRDKRQQSTLFDG